MKPLCVIPARLGSKRLPRKNLLLLSGRSLVARAVDAALASGIFDRVYVSTESPEIASEARCAGAEVPGLRDPALAGDTVTNVAVSLDLHDRLAAGGVRYDAVVCLQPSSPLRTAVHISEAWRKFDAMGADFLVSVTSIDPHDFHWALHENRAGLEPFFGDRYLRVRQDLPIVYRPNGAIKIAAIAPLRRHNTFLGPRLVGYTMPPEVSVHVAAALDLKLCEALLQ